MEVKETLPAVVEPKPVARPAFRYDTLERMASALAHSGLFGIKTPAQALGLMLVAQAEGRHPASVAQDYNIIQGRPALKADAILARFQQAGGVVEWEQIDDKRVAARFSHPKCSPKPVLIDWTLDRAKTAELGGKEMYHKYPRQMLRARVISEGVRTVYPAACCGIYTPEEVQDFAPESPARTDIHLTISDDKDALSRKVADKFEGEVMGDEAEHVPPPEAAPPSGGFCCPKCSGPVVDQRGKLSRAGKKLPAFKCSAGHYNRETKATEGCNWTEWDENFFDKETAREPERSAEAPVASTTPAAPAAATSPDAVLPIDEPHKAALIAAFRAKRYTRKGVRKKLEPYSVDTIDQLTEAQAAEILADLGPVALDAPPPKPATRTCPPCGSGNVGQKGLDWFCKDCGATWEEA